MDSDHSCDAAPSSPPPVRKQGSADRLHPGSAGASHAKEASVAAFKQQRQAPAAASAAGGTPRGARTSRIPTLNGLPLSRMPGGAGTPKGLGQGPQAAKEPPRGSQTARAATMHAATLSTKVDRTFLHISAEAADGSSRQGPVPEVRPCLNSQLAAIGFVPHLQPSSGAWNKSSRMPETAWPRVAAADACTSESRQPAEAITGSLDSVSSRPLAKKHHQETSVKSALSPAPGQAMEQVTVHEGSTLGAPSAAESGQGAPADRPWRSPLAQDSPKAGSAAGLNWDTCGDLAPLRSFLQCSPPSTPRGHAVHTPRPQQLDCVPTAARLHASSCRPPTEALCADIQRADLVGLCQQGRVGVPADHQQAVSGMEGCSPGCLPSVALVPGRKPTSEPPTAVLHDGGAAMAALSTSSVGSVGDVSSEGPPSPLAPAAAAAAVGNDHHSGAACAMQRESMSAPAGSSQMQQTLGAEPGLAAIVQSLLSPDGKR